MEPAARCVLEAEQVEVAYGAIRAVQGASLTVAPRQLAALVGPNGAGKSSFLRALAGVVPLAAGRLRIGGTDCAHMRPKDRVRRLGVALIPEGRGVFGTLTVLENLELGSYSRRDGGIRDDVERVFELFPRLKERQKQPAGTLSGGEQQMLAIGRALMARPKVLLLDEPSMGLSPVLTETIFRTIIEINKQGTTILLVEQNARLALAICRRGYVIQTGRIVLSDTGKALLANELVRKTYLGEE